MANFTEQNQWDNVELLYAPPGDTEPQDTDTPNIGSTNHASVFNRRLQSLVNRSRYLYNLVKAGIVNQLLELPKTPNEYLKFDNEGNLISQALEIPSGADAYMVGQLIMVSFEVVGNPYVDDRGYNWFVPDGNTLTPTVAAYEPLYKKIWVSIPPSMFIGGIKGSTAQEDWDNEVVISYPDLRDKYLHCLSLNRPINQQFGDRNATIPQEAFKHSHNLSVRGVLPAVINGQNAFNYSTAGGGYGMIAYSESGNDYPFNPSPTNIKGDRSVEGDQLGAIWENTDADSTGLELNLPGVSFQPLIYTGTRTE